MRFNKSHWFIHISFMLTVLVFSATLSANDTTRATQSFEARYKLVSSITHSEPTILYDYNMESVYDPERMRLWRSGPDPEFTSTEIKMTENGIQMMKGTMRDAWERRAFLHYKSSLKEMPEPYVLFVLADEWDCQLKDQKLAGGR